MKTLLKINLLLLLAVTAIFNFTSCKEDENLPDPPRLFAPIPGVDAGGTWIKVSWDKYEGTTSYHLTLYDDSTHLNVLKDTVTAETAYTFENLWYNTEYYVAITSLGDNIKSRTIIGTIRTGKFPTKMLVPTANDYLDTEVRVRWEAEDYDSLRIFSGKDFVRTEILTPADNEKKEYIISGLKPATRYTVECYKTNEYLGEQDYPTVAAQIIEGDYVDLRDLETAETYSKLNATYFDSLATAYPAGVTVILKGGAHYEITTGVRFSTKVKLVSGLSFAGRAVLESKQSFAVTAGASVPEITFENLIFTDHPTLPRTEANFGGQYIFNFNQADGTVGKVNINNCDIRYKRGIIRAQIATRIDTILINNCIIDSIGGYGIINADHASAYFKDVILKNSTIAHAQLVLVATKPAPVDQCNSITMENMTFCYAPVNNSRYFINYQNQTLPGGITVKNCLFGAGWEGAVRGMQSAASNVTATESYCAKDLEWHISGHVALDLAPVTETTDQLFEAPQDVNFKITNTELINRKVGDPRWW